MEKQIKMNANESPFDVPVQTKGRFIERLVDLNLNRYPSTDAAELRKLIAKKYGISDDMVIVGDRVRRDHPDDCNGVQK